MTRLFFSGPAITRSTASSISGMPMVFLLRRAARMAASFIRLARSAPEKPGVELGDVVQADIRLHGLALDVELQDRLAAVDVGLVQHHLAIEAAGAQQRRVQDVGPVGGSQDDDVDVAVEAVHLHQNLVQGLLALVVRAAQAGAAMAADGVELVDEDDAGRVLLGLVEEVAHAAGADADEHLDELGAADGEEGHASLAGHGAGQQRLADARRANQQHALGDAGAQGGELLRDTSETRRLPAAPAWPRPRRPRRRR